MSVDWTVSEFTADHGEKAERLLAGGITSASWATPDRVVARERLARPVPVVKVGDVRMGVLRRGVLVPMAVPAFDRKLGMGVPMVAVIVTVAVGVAERLVGMLMGVTVERQQGDGAQEAPAREKLHAPEGLVEHRP